MEYLDLALNYLKDHKLLTAAIAFLFIVLLIRNFWFVVKLLVALSLAAVALVLLFSFIGKATKEKRDLIKPDESSGISYFRDQGKPVERLTGSFNKRADS